MTAPRSEGTIGTKGVAVCWRQLAGVCMIIRHHSFRSLAGLGETVGSCNTMYIFSCGLHSSLHGVITIWPLPEQIGCPAFSCARNIAVEGTWPVNLLASSKNYRTRFSAKLWSRAGCPMRPFKASKRPFRLCQTGVVNKPKSSFPWAATCFVLGFPKSNLTTPNLVLTPVRLHPAPPSSTAARGRACYRSILWSTPQMAYSSCVLLVLALVAASCGQSQVSGHPRSSA